MGCALFGKLPAKRDFVALGAPREFLTVWEPWLQGGLSASRMHLREAWRDAFLRAPIWRFWLGASLCGGTAAAGAFMPSVDGVGRYFPLTVLARATAGGAPIPPPELDPQEVWFGAAEDLLLSALAADATFESLSAAVGGMQAPRDGGTEPLPEATLVFPDGTIGSRLADQTLPDRLAAVRVAGHARAYAAATFWWTVGGEGFPSLALVAQGMPDPHLFTGMLTGRFDAVLAPQG